jgi:hypothetical protein
MGKTFNSGWVNGVSHVELIGRGELQLHTLGMSIERIRKIWETHTTKQ